MENQFDIGQKVWDSFYFPGEEGVITNILPGYAVPISVKFENAQRAYSLDGKWILRHPTEAALIPTLKPYPYEVEFKKIAHCPFKKWDRVLVKDHIDDPWKPGLFDEYDSTSESNWRIQAYGWYKLIHPWDESLIGKIGHPESPGDEDNEDSTTEYDPNDDPDSPNTKVIIEVLEYLVAMGLMRRSLLADRRGHHLLSG